MASGVSCSGGAPRPGGGSPWEPFWTPKHRRAWFFNKDTGESVWELPSVPRPSTGTLSRGSSQFATGASPTGTDGGPWHQVWSPKHERHYYYHELTREAVWELPTVSRPSAPPPAVHDPDTSGAHQEPEGRPAKRQRIPSPLTTIRSAEGHERKPAAFDAHGAGASQPGRWM